MHWSAKYVGLPFVEDFHGPGFNCWTLVRKVMKDEAGVELPAYGELSSSELMAVAGTISEVYNSDPWTRISGWAKPRAFDVVVMGGRIKGEQGFRRAPIHVGIMADSTSVLHIEKGTDSVLVPLEHPSVKFRVMALCRHKEVRHVATV